MWKSFVDGYKSSGAPDMHIVFARVLGLAIKVVMCTVIAISVARIMGVPL